MSRKRRRQTGKQSGDWRTSSNTRNNNDTTQPSEPPIDSPCLHSSLVVFVVVSSSFFRCVLTLVLLMRFSILACVSVLIPTQRRSTSVSEHTEPVTQEEEQDTTSRRQWQGGEERALTRVCLPVCVCVFFCSRLDDDKPLVLNVVKKAESIIAADKSLNHEYLDIAGDTKFVNLSRAVLFGKDVSTTHTHRQ